jgi:hypothetical protein
MPAIDELEQRLEDQLSKVRSQKALALRRIAAVEAFDPALLPPPPAGAAPQDLAAIFDDRFLATLDPSSGRPRAAKLAKLLVEECPGVYSFPLLKAEFCANLVETGHQFAEYVEANEIERLVGQDRPKMLDLMQLAWLNDLLLDAVINPLAHMTMQEELQGEPLDFRHGYIVGYGPLLRPAEDAPASGASMNSGGDRAGGGDGSGGEGNTHGLAETPKEAGGSQRRHTRDHLIPHSDDAEATLNVALRSL